MRSGDAAATPALLHEFFERAAAKHPAAIAIDVPKGIDRPDRSTASYAELQGDARAIAAWLGGFVDRECVVAILLERDGAAPYAAQLGVLMAGAAYLGLEAAFPDEHLRYLLEDSGAVAVIGDCDAIARVRRVAPSMERVLDFATLLGAAPATASGPPRWLTPSTLAYLVYTSGTTGRPKAVMIEHRSIANLVASDVDEFGLGPGDRIAQGSSPAYDSSVEETWLALAAGATIVPLDDATVRLGPDLVPWLRAERITVLCPPPTLLRTTGCPDPRAALPELRLIYAGGEALPQDLADVWSRGRRFVNGYGPTECTVTVVRGDVRPGEPVAIGTAVHGNRTFVLDERLDDVADDESGELCITGIGLARGYLGRPELTAEKFVEHPRHGRIYRTGDRVRRDARGVLFYAGRIDAQVKLRGHRVELAEIEARLVECDGVREAACAVQDGAFLVAFVVGDDPSNPPDPARLGAALRARVPAHMVPAQFALLQALPTSVGGKLDRKRLPAIAVVATPVGRAPGDDLEQAIAAAAAQVLRIPAVPVDGDFFALGGDSVRAATLVSILREEPLTAGLSVRDVYEARTVEGLAVRARASGHAANLGPVVAPTGTRPLLVTAAQTLWLALELTAGSALVWLLAFAVLPTLLDWCAPWLLVLLLPLGFLVGRLTVGAFALAATVAIKRLLIGRYSAGRHAVWRGWYLRHWIVTRSAQWVPWGTLTGTELHALALRALGARIGARVHIHRGVDLTGGGWDLLEVGDDASLAQDVALGLVELDRGHVVTGPVRIGRGATLEVRAGVAAHGTVGDGACLTALSALPAHATIPAGERWEGVPARPAGSVAPPAAVTHASRDLGPIAHTAAVLALRAILAGSAGLPFLVGIILLLAVWGVDSGRAQAWIEDPMLTPGGVSVLFGVLFVTAPLGLLLQALALRWGPRSRAGVMRRRSLAHVIVLLRTRAVEFASAWLSGTLFWPLWLRIAGARIGARSEVSTIVDVLPEQIAIGQDSFLADGIYLGGPRIDRGTVTVGGVEIGRESFLGNHVVVHPGTSLPDRVLIGVCTVADAPRMRADSSWFGHPAFELPRREVVEVERRLTFEPGALRYANRVLWEAARFLIPIVPTLALLLWWDVAAASPLAAVPLVSLGVGLGLVGCVLAAKWLLLGRVRPGQHGLWSCWCSRWDFLYVLWGFVGRQALEHSSGTLWLGWYLRAMGVRIGKRVVLGPGFAQVVDPDMLAFEDDATIDTHFQAHSFEDRVLKIDRVTIRTGATLMRDSVVLYGADIGAGCRVLPHSVVMKNEHLLPGRDHQGVPTRSS